MPTKTKIEWTDYSTNPLKYRDRETGQVVWACVHKSEGCTHCYAETLAKRWHRGRPFTAPNITQVEPFLDPKEINALLTSSAICGKRVFVEDMSDLFGEWIDLEMLQPLWDVFVTRADVTFQVLTKRPQCMAEWADEMQAEATKPLSNVWWGTSVENQGVAYERIRWLMQCRGPVHFLSVEPMIGPLDLRVVDWNGPWPHPVDVLRFGYWQDPRRVGINGFVNHGDMWDTMSPVNWVIAGGESGPGKRPLDLDWARSLRDQCREAEVPFFFKQIDGRKPIPDDLLVREFPRG